MKKPIEIRWPRSGVSDDQAHGKQLPETTPHAKNVRTLDPKSGRSQGAQRPGWANFTSKPLHPGESVDALASVSVDLPKIEYRGPTESEIREQWGHTVPGLRDALALTVDRDGNLYVLDAVGSFEKMGPDGKVGSVQTFFVPQGEAVVPRIQVDYDGAVYVATSHPLGISGRVLRFERLEDGDDNEEVAYSEAWNYAGLFGVRDFRVYAGALALARFYSAKGDGAPSEVALLGALYSPEPQELYVTQAPSPLSTIAINDNGEVIGAAPENPDRGAGLSGEGWVDPIESWSPHELEDVNGFGASNRLHAWWDAQTLANSLVDSAPVKSVPDRRWLHTSLDFDTTALISENEGALSGGGSVEYIPVNDLKPRPLRRYAPVFMDGFGGTNVLEDEIPFPILRQGTAGTLPGIHFEDSGLLAANAKDPLLRPLSEGKKTDTDAPLDGSPNEDGVMDKQACLWPTHDRAVFSIFLLIRYVPSSTGEVIFYHRTDNGYTFCLVKGVDSGDIYTAPTPLSPTPVTQDRLTLYVGHPTEPGARAANKSGTGTAYEVASCDLTDADFDNPQRVALVCIQNAGKYALSPADGPSQTVGRSLFRVNGRTVDRFTMTHGESGPAAETGFGVGEPASNIFSHSGSWIGGNPVYESWTGDLLEVITVLGDTSTSTLPNEDPVTWPGFPAEPEDPGVAGQYTDMSGQNYSSDPAAYTSAASEIERMEGYLAYRWGCPNILKGGSAPSVAAGFQDMHPFGYDSGGLPQPPVGSPAAGGSVINETGLALFSPRELLFKLGTSGTVQWALDGGGHGLGVAAGSDGSVIAVGRHESGDTTIAKKVKDLGPTVRTTGEDTWELKDPDNLEQRAVPGMVVDAAGRLYWPHEDAPYSVLVTFDSPPTDSEVFFTVATDGTTVHSYIFQTTLSAVANSTSVLVGADKAESLANLVAAINKTGDSSVQYLIDPQRDEANPYFKASQESDGTSSELRVTRKGPPGKTRFSIPNTTSYTFSEFPDGTLFVPPANTQAIIPARPGPRLESRSGEDGSLIWSKEYGDLSGQSRPLAVALDPDVPLYPDNDPLEGVPEFVYVGQRNNVDSDGTTSETPTGDNVQKIRQVERVQVIGADRSPRRTVHTATCGGDFFVVEKGKAPKLVNNGHDAFNAASPFAKLWTYRQKVYGLDGQSYIRFDPKKLLLEEWVAEGAGKIPYGAKLACVFAGCIVLGRTADDPHNFHLSERGNPDGWDTDPSVITPLSAFSGNSTGNLNFRKNDLVNCLIPARDDLLIIGGDQSITRLSGHPGTGGQLDNISTSEGLAFGDAYCVGPGGTVFAKTINGGVLRLAPNGAMDRISLRSIERRLQDVDLTEYDIRMAWNFRREGLHVVQVPKGIGKRIVEHWFWDAKEGGWWPDEMSVTMIQPTSLGVFDGDHPDDRTVVMGCEDGFIRYESEDAKNDGGHRIESEIVFGPLVPDGAGRARFSHVEPTLSSFGDSAEVQVFTDDVADIIAGKDPVYKGTAGPGFKGYNMLQAAGNQAWIKLRNAADDEAWSLESLFVRARMVGKRRRF